MLTFETNKLEKMIDRGLDFLTNRPKYQALIASRAVQYQEIENVLAQLIVLKDVDTAVGEQLKQLGLLVGEIYKGQPEDSYRIMIKGRIFSNSLSSRANEILYLFEDHHLVERASGFSLRSIQAQTEEQAHAANIVLQRIKGGGIEADYQYNGYVGTTHFKFESTVSLRSTYFYRYWPNIWQDGDCDSENLDYWNSENVIITKSVSQRHTASGYSLQGDPTTVSSNVYNWSKLTRYKKYFYSLWFYINQNLSYVALKVNTSEFYRTSLPVATWYNLKGYFIPNSADPYLKIYVEITDTSGVLYYIDDCIVYEME